MVDVDVLTVKLTELAARTARVRKHCPPSAEALAADADALDLVSFNLLLAVQACLDIATHIIADEGLPPAKTLAQAFERLHDHGVVSATTARVLGQAAGLRNVVAHGYGGVDPGRVHAAATEGLGDLERFAQEVAKWAAGRTTP